MSDLKTQIETVNTVIQHAKAEALSWENERSKYDRVLVGERFIVVDRHDRTFRQAAEQYSLQRSSENLQGVSHLTKENAEKVVKHLSESTADAAPYRAVDFQAYADERAREARGVAIVARQAKELLLAPYMSDQHFNDWTNIVTSLWSEDRDNGLDSSEDSEHTKHARAVVAAAAFEQKPDGSVTPKAGADAIYGPRLRPAQEEALAVFRAKHGADWQEALSEQWQRASYPGMNENHAAALQDMRNNLGPEWLSGVYEVPSALGRESVKLLVVEINDTANAAFVDAGRDQEISRLIRDAAEIVSGFPDDVVVGKSVNISVPLHDINGNSVGWVNHVDASPSADVAPGNVRLVLEVSRSSFEQDAASSVSQILNNASAKLGEGQREFTLYDVNGSPVGAALSVDEPSLVVDGRISMQAQIASGNVYKADDGFSGIADGEYRYIVADFEVGYGRGEGPVYLVNADGDVASGYESPQTVAEKLFDPLKGDELKSLIDVSLGDASLEDHERRFYGDEPEPI